VHQQWLQGVTRRDGTAANPPAAAGQTP